MLYTLWESLGERDSCIRVRARAERSRLYVAITYECVRGGQMRFWISYMLNRGTISGNGGEGISSRS